MLHCMFNCRVSNSIGVSFTVALISMALGVVIGTLFGALRCSRNAVVRIIPLVYIEPIRNSPLIIQLFLIFFGIPMLIHYYPSHFMAAIVGLSLNTGAFFAVLVHSSIKAVPKGQWEAGYALGHGTFSTFRHVIFRQALRIIIPPSITLFVSQLQMSSVVSLIGLIDIARAGQILTERTMKPFLIFFIVFALYFVISFPLAKLARRMELKLNFTI